MHDKRTRSIMLIVMTLIGFTFGCWLYAWLSGVLSYWGAGTIASHWIGAAGTILVLSTFFVRPIPIKVTTIAAIYLIIFSFFAWLVQKVLTGVWPSTAGYGWLWQGGIAALVCSAVMLIYGVIHGRRMIVKRYTLHTPLPVPGGELRIALISDVHMGLTINADRLRQQIDRLAEEKPDLLVIAGDLVDDQTTPEEMRAACALVGSLPTAHGVYFAYGNHDLASHGPTPPYTKAELDEALINANIHILDDTHIDVAGVTLVGRHDAAFRRNADRASLEQLLDGVDFTKPVILIDHQPRELKEAASAGVTLQLSGHTHAGQVWPMSRLSRLFGVSYGHKHIGDMDVIVSSGMGNRGSVLRSGCTAEMVLISLRGAASNKE